MKFLKKFAGELIADKNMEKMLCDKNSYGNEAGMLKLLLGFTNTVHTQLLWWIETHKKEIKDIGYSGTHHELIQFSSVFGKNLLDKQNQSNEEIIDKSVNEIHR